MTKQIKKYTDHHQNYWLGVLGELMVREMFPLTTKGGRHADVRILTPKKPKTGVRIEVKTARRTWVKNSSGFKINFTRFQRGLSDFFVILCLDDDFSTSRMYFVPRFAMPRGRMFLWLGKSNIKYEQYRLV